MSKLEVVHIVRAATSADWDNLVHLCGQRMVNREGLVHRSATNGANIVHR